MIEIVTPGPLATVQDLGRHGYYDIGVGFCGAMDPLALIIANRLVDNDDGAAAIEFTIGSFEIRFEHDTVFALAGADCAVKLDAVEIPPFWSAHAKAGQVLKATAPRHGMRTYLAIAGGLAVEPVLGSRSTDMKGGFGGLGGRALKAGDRLPLTTPATLPIASDFGLDPRALSSFYEAGYPDEVSVRFLAAAEYSSFEDTALDLFRDEAWTIQPDSNRIGYRLAGPVLDLKAKLELRSHGIMPGTIQVPPSGQPVIQLSDANTCGGYPKIGVVITADLWRLGQARLGGRLRFVEVSREEAIGALCDRNACMSAVFSQIGESRRAL